MLVDILLIVTIILILVFSAVSIMVDNDTTPPCNKLDQARQQPHIITQSAMSMCKGGDTMANSSGLLSSPCAGPLDLQTGAWCAPKRNPSTCQNGIPAQYQKLLQESNDKNTIIELQYTADCPSQDHLRYIFNNVRDDIMSSFYGQSYIFTTRQMAGCGNGEYPRVVKWALDTSRCSISNANTYGSLRDWVLL